jgi:hypothetical protein
MAALVNRLPDNSPGAFAAAEAGLLADRTAAELQRLAAVISGASVAPKPARHEPRGVR